MEGIVYVDYILPQVYNYLQIPIISLDYIHVWKV